MWKTAYPYIKYEVSDNGEVRNKRTGHVMRAYPNNRGYLKVPLMDSGSQKSVFVHRLVAKAFVSNDDPIKKTQVNHLNEDKTDNRATNLEWVTPSENVNYGTGTARRVKSQSFQIVMTFKGLSVLFDSASDAERRTGIPAKSIQKCCVGKLKTTHGATFSYVKDREVIA